MISIVALNKESVSMESAAALECTLVTDFTAEVRNEKHGRIGGTKVTKRVKENWLNFLAV